FDAHIKDLFSQYTLPLAPEAWKDFLFQVHHRWDDEIKHILSSYEFPYTTESWAPLKANLDGHAWETLLIQKIQSLALPLDTQSWQALEALLDEFSEDSLVRHKLDEHEMVMDAFAWDTFEAFRQGSFDQTLKEKLTSPVLDTMEGQAWDQLAEALDGNAFDHQIRKLLVDFQVPYQPAHWVDMQERLEWQFDQLLRQKLGSYRISPIHRDWMSLSSTLRKEGLQRTPVIAMRPWMRGAVAAAILLLFLMVGTLWQGAPQESWLSFKQVIEEATRVGKRSNQTSENTSTKAVEENHIAESSSPQSANTPKDSLFQALDLQPIAERSQVDALGQFTQQVIESRQTSLSSNALAQDDEAETEHTDEEALDGSAIIIAAYREIQSIKRDYAIALADDVPQDHQAQLSSRLGRRIPDLAFGLHGGMTMTKVELNGPKSDPGYSAGLRVKLKLNDKWAIVSGFSYGEKRFYYEYLSSENAGAGAFGNVGNRAQANLSTNVKAIQGDFVVVDLPLLLRYTIPSENTLRLYVQGGMMNTISLREDYIDFDPASPINSDLPDISNVAGLEGSGFVRNLKTYPGNIYVAMGIEFPVTKNTSMEIEPYFLQNLQRTKEAEGLDIRKRLYTTGISLSFMFDYQE
ncbi:MAG: outer membrane beta-barrel protein, partial [Bacteroidota bacterium]